MAIQTQVFTNNLGFPMRGSSQDLMINNECFNTQQDLQHLYHDRQMSHNMFVDTNHHLFSNNNIHTKALPPPSISQSLNLLLEKHDQDMDRYIRLQVKVHYTPYFCCFVNYITSSYIRFFDCTCINVGCYTMEQNEKLSILLREQRKRQVVTLLKKVEAEAIHMLSRKDEEIAQARMKRMELEELLTRLEEENQAWRKVAEEKEAMVLSLYNTLEHVNNGFNNNNNGAISDEGSCCNQEDDVEVDVEVEESERKMMVNCKSCGCGKACVLFLPCRHVCSCRECEGMLQSCPVCRTPKKATIEILI